MVEAKGDLGSLVGGHQRDGGTEGEKVAPGGLDAPDGGGDAIGRPHRELVVLGARGKCDVRLHVESLPKTWSPQQGPSGDRAVAATPPDESAGPAEAHWVSSVLVGNDECSGERDGRSTRPHPSGG